MDNRQRRTVKSLSHILAFLEKHRVTPEPRMLAGRRESLAASVKRLDVLGQEQYNAQIALRGDITRKPNKLRRERMIPLARIAKPVLAYAPGAERALRVPHARSSTYTIASAALKMIELLMKHAKVLRAAGVSKEFVTQFRAEATELSLKARDTRVARQRLTRATAGIAAELKKARRTRGILDGLVLLHMGGDKLAMHMWNHDRRIGARIGRPRKRRSVSRDLTT